MAIINKLENIASILYGGNTVESLPVDTLLDLTPTIVKLVDKATAKIGDTLTYTVTVTNLNLTQLTNIPFTDVLPTGSTYVTGSFQVGGAPATPTVTNNTLTYTIPTVAVATPTVIQFQAKVVGGSI